MKLLTTSNPKTQKGVKYGFLTAIQHFAPSKLSGVNVCKYASPECIRFCLNKAGRGGIVKKGETTNAIQQARLARTKLFLDHPFAYRGQLFKEIAAHQLKASKLNLDACVRLNGTSDIAWEDECSSVFWRFQGVQFYDYTKSFTRMQRYLSSDWMAGNYHLTFSRSELNDAQCDWVISHGGNVAVVFDQVPTEYKGRRVVSGDDHDLRFLDIQGVYVGLTAKGKLKRSDSSFMVGAELT